MSSNVLKWFGDLYIEDKNKKAEKDIRPRRPKPKQWFSNMIPFPMRNQPLLQYSSEYIEPSTDNGRSPADVIREITANYNGPHNGSGLKRTDWDGVTTFGGDEYNPDATNGNEDYLLAGLHQLYDHLRPFEDEYNPTVAEIDNWNIEVCKHFRKLMGKSNPKATRATFLLARWQTMREYGTVYDLLPWDGIFIPPLEDQAPFLNGYPQYPDDNGDAVITVPTTSNTVGFYYGPYTLPAPHNWFRFMSDWLSKSATWFLDDEVSYFGINIYLGNNSSTANVNLFSIYDDVYTYEPPPPV